jgi:hypothetical protein
MRVGELVMTAARAVKVLVDPCCRIVGSEGGGVGDGSRVDSCD